jgi:probable phosphoglycerate mutase
MDVTPLPALCEIDHGSWNGKSRDELLALDPQGVAAYDADPFNFKPEGGECGLDVLNRAVPAIGNLVRDHPNNTIMVVAHKTTNRLLICRFLGLDPALYRAKMAQRPACLNVLEFTDENSAELLLFNDIGHYGMSDKSTYGYVV